MENEERVATEMEAFDSDGGNEPKRLVESQEQAID